MVCLQKTENKGCLGHDVSRTINCRPLARNKSTYLLELIGLSTNFNHPFSNKSTHRAQTSAKASLVQFRSAYPKSRSGLQICRLLSYDFVRFLDLLG